LEKTIFEIPWIVGIHGIRGIFRIFEILGILGIIGIIGIPGICGIQEFQNCFNSRISPNFRNLENKVLEFGYIILEKSGIPRISKI
jgi:hypothetical protein